MKWFNVSLLALAILASACDRDAPESASAVEGTEVAENVEGAMKEVEEAAQYDEGMKKKACDILTPAMVAETFDVPEGELEQVKALGCVYNWEKDDEVLEARFGSIRVHDSVDWAEKWFGNATKGMTAEETKKAMADITEKAKKDERIDTEHKKKAADKLGGMLGAMGSVSFEDFDGIADEARINTGDGELWARKGNMTFIVKAYKGPKMPTPEVKMKPGETKAYMKKIMAANREWTQKTMPQRKKATRALAEKILAKL